MDLIGRHKLTVKAIVSTHAHMIHVGGLQKMHSLYGRPVLMHSADLPLYHAMDEQPPFLNSPPQIGEVHQMCATATS